MRKRKQIKSLDYRIFDKLWLDRELPQNSSMVLRLISYDGNTEHMKAVKYWIYFAET